MVNGNCSTTTTEAETPIEPDDFHGSASDESDDENESDTNSDCNSDDDDNDSNGNTDGSGTKGPMSNQSAWTVREERSLIMHF